MKQLIFITGIPSAGKSTIARKLKSYFGLNKKFGTDYVYIAIGEELEIEDFPNPKKWADLEPSLIKELKIKYYSKMLPRDDKILVEGYGLMFKEDRDIIKELLPEHKIISFYKDISYENWLRQKGIVDCEERKREFEYLKAVGTIEPNTIILK